MEPHPLVRQTALPRSVGFAFCAVFLSVHQPLVAVAAVIYPFIVHLAFTYLRASAHLARSALAVDALLAAVVVAFCGFDPWVSTAIAAASKASTASAERARWALALK